DQLGTRLLELVAEPLVELPRGLVVRVDREPDAGRSALARLLVQALRQLAAETAAALGRVHGKPEARNVEAHVPAAQHPVGADAPVLDAPRVPVLALGRAHELRLFPRERMRVEGSFVARLAECLEQLRERLREPGPEALVRHATRTVFVPEREVTAAP